MFAPVYQSLQPAMRSQSIWRLGATASSTFARRPTLLRSYATPVEYLPKEADPQLNGYPELPRTSLQTRSPYGWWDIQGRRNYGETLHAEHDQLDMFGPDISKVPPRTAARQLGIASASLLAFAWIVYTFKPESPAVPRQYPYSGLVKELGGLQENKALEESSDEEE
ncbi:Ndufb8, NADH dehydrogenase 19kDa subunit [Sistotremastrum niveocremeum HHB9708]|uniref:Ndufb8, NADH dehydrogenase 19kDa subunit n=2 Tax=Sistotremastraceae TaxID=3402574 RepID=A0A164VLC9_9AGAM|nr:Ndufb8, NADH dehydrogenase 19kDa subunit [Sistotremastrum niveocremeum HHB9708]KZT41208.1 Ndufb8, NADH dehydrogenase 19kDa subunit [Sistotremastrum suecicum HHB10207 ss-3]